MGRFPTVVYHAQVCQSHRFPNTRSSQATPSSTWARPTRCHILQKDSVALFCAVSIYLRGSLSMRTQQVYVTDTSKRPRRPLLVHVGQRETCTLKKHWLAPRHALRPLQGQARRFGRVQTRSGKYCTTPIMTLPSASSVSQQAMWLAACHPVPWSVRLELSQGQSSTGCHCQLRAASLPAIAGYNPVLP